jgi:hypothetical protein
MHTHAVLDDCPGHLDELDHLERIGEIRSQLLGHIAEGIAAMQRAAQALEQLRSNSIYDAEFVDGRDGGDVSTFLDDSIRYARAGYAVVHTVIDKETP